MNEQILWNRIKSDPATGKVLDLAADPRFPPSNGWQKMQATHTLPDGKKITIHYQYNRVTNKAYDMKVVTPQPNPIQPLPSIGP